MPTSSSSSIHLSHQSRRRSKNVPASAVGKLVPVETTCYPNNMRPREEPKKLVSNGYLAKKEKVVRYRECRKNHAANIGGFALDGCREFMASGEEGTSAALRCAACSCHRSFHKREVENTETFSDCSSDSTTQE